MNVDRAGIRALLESLRARGVDIGADDYLRCLRLFDSRTEWQASEIRVALRALLARGGRALPAFEESWREVVTPEASPELVEHAPQPTEPARRWSWLWMVGLLATASAAGVAGFQLKACSAEPAGSGMLPPPPPGLPPRALPTQGMRLELPSGLRARLIDDQAAMQWEPAPAPEWPCGLLVAAMMAAAGSVLLVVSDRRRKSAYLPGPYEVEPRLDDPARLVAAGEQETRRLVDALRSPTVGDTLRSEIDIDRSVHLTASAGGAPHLVARSRLTHAPTLVVVERTRARWRLLFDRLVARLRSAGAELVVATHDGDLEHLSLGPRVATWTEAASDAVRALVVGTPFVRGLPRAIGAPASEVSLAVISGDALAHAQLHLPPERVGLATTKGLTAILEGARSPGPVPFETWDSASQDRLARLRASLGEDGLHALALASLVEPPNLLCAITIARATGLRLSEETWYQLASLPWMESDRWPSGLPETLQNELPKLRLWEALDSWEEILRASEPSQGTGAHLRWQLEMALATDNTTELRDLADTPIAEVVRERLARRSPSMREARGMLRSRRQILAMVLGFAALAMSIAFEASSIVLASPDIEASCERASDARQRARACLALGVRHARGELGVAYDPERALELYRTSCGLEASEACARVARWELSYGQVDEALASFSRSCVSGAERGCKEAECALLDELDNALDDPERLGRARVERLNGLLAAATAHPGVSPSGELARLRAVVATDAQSEIGPNQARLRDAIEPWLRSRATACVALWQRSALARDDCAASVEGAPASCERAAWPSWPPDTQRTWVVTLADESPAPILTLERQSDGRVRGRIRPLQSGSRAGISGTWDASSRELVLTGRLNDSSETDTASGSITADGDIVLRIDENGQQQQQQRAELMLFAVPATQFLLAHVATRPFERDDPVRVDECEYDSIRSTDGGPADLCQESFYLATVRLGLVNGRMRWRAPSGTLSSPVECECTPRTRVPECGGPTEGIEASDTAVCEASLRVGTILVARQDGPQIQWQASVERPQGPRTVTCSCPAPVIASDPTREDAGVAVVAPVRSDAGPRCNERPPCGAEGWNARTCRYGLHTESMPQVTLAHPDRSPAALTLGHLCAPPGHRVRLRLDRTQPAADIRLIPAAMSRPDATKEIDISVFVLGAVLARAQSSDQAGVTPFPPSFVDVDVPADGRLEITARSGRCFCMGCNQPEGQSPCEVRNVRISVEDLGRP